MIGKTPFFSIIIPCLNEEKVIPLLLGDIKKQPFKDYEVIVVDGDSTDKTQEIISRDASVLLVITKTRNVAFQRNLGAKQAKGKYLVFFDADSRIKPDFLVGLAYRLVLAKPEMYTCWAEVSPTDKDNKIIASLINMSLELSKFMDSPTAMGTMMGFKTSAFRLLKGFDPKITFGEDTEIIKRGHKLDNNFEIFKDPRYIYSLRRFKAEGTLTMLRKYAKLNSKTLLGKYPTYNLDLDYPMLGGSLYDKQKQKISFIAQVENSLKKVKDLTKLKKWQQYWDRLIRD